MKSVSAVSGRDIMVVKLLLYFFLCDFALFFVLLFFFLFVYLYVFFFVFSVSVKVLIAVNSLGVI